MTNGQRTMDRGGNDDAMACRSNAPGEERQASARIPQARRALRAGLFVILLVLIFLVIDRAGSRTIKLEGWQENLAAATATAKENDRPLLLFFHARWCGACYIFMRDVLVDPDVSKRLKEQFVPTSVDTTTAGGPGDINSARFGVDAIPTVISLNPNGQLLGGFTGAIPRKAFHRWLDTCLARRNPGDISDQDHPASDVADNVAH